MTEFGCLGFFIWVLWSLFGIGCLGLGILPFGVLCGDIFFLHSPPVGEAEVLVKRSNIDV